MQISRVATKLDGRKHQDGFIDVVAMKSITTGLIEMMKMSINGFGKVTVGGLIKTSAYAINESCVLNATDKFSIRIASIPIAN